MHRLGGQLTLPLYVAVSGLVALLFVIYPGINGYQAAMFPDMVYGQAHQPFVSRALLPTCVRIVSSVVPQRAVESAVSFSSTDPAMQKLFAGLGWEPEYVIEYLAAVLMFFICFFGFALVMRRLVGICYDYHEQVANLTPLVALVVLPTFFRYYNYIYDPSTLCLFALGILLIRTRRHSWYYPVYVMACFNKETSILLAALYILHEYNYMDRANMVRHVVAQVSLWLIVRFWLIYLYSDNAGATLQFQMLDHNLQLYRHPLALAYFLSAVVLWWALVQLKWKEKPLFFRVGLLITVLPLILAALFFGFIDELRGYYEAYPFLVLLSLPTILGVLGCAPDAERAG